MNDFETMFAPDCRQIHHRRTEARNDIPGSKPLISRTAPKVPRANVSLWHVLALIAFTLSAPLTQAAAAERTAAVMASKTPISLERAEKLFMERNRELQFARRATESSEADVLSASAAPNPELSIGSSRISPSVGIGTGPLSQKRVDTVIGISQVFERGNKRELRTEAAQFSAVAARNDENDFLRQQRQGLYFAYYDLLQAQERLNISESTSALFEKSVAAADRRFKAGDIAATELSRIQVDALRARNDVRSAQADLERSQIALAYLIGAEKDAGGIVASDSWPALATAKESPSVEKALEQRADIRAAQERIKAAEKNRELARALLTRDVTAGVQYERFPGDVSNNSYGLTVSIPLFTRNLYTGEIRRAEIELENARENLERVRAVALGEIRRANNDLDAAAERVERLTATLLPTAEKAAKGAEFAYERGAIGIMDLLDARRQFYAVRIESVSAQADYAKALAAKRSATALTSD